ncbi:MAG: hypothetical protein E7632_04080 [Ruminococcaceae bacterium]|nr:hypothetical protein [Oscillospiraceae bacterium]
MKTRITTALLLIAMLASVSCGGEASVDTTADTASDTTTAEVTTSIPELDIPDDVDYGGATFTVEAIDARGKPTQAINNPFSLEEANGDILNDIVFEAVERVEERLNIQFAQQYSRDAFDYGRLRTNAMSGDGSIDAFSYIDRFGVNQTADGCVIPYGDIPNINLENPWWYEDINNAISIANKLCYAVGAMNLDVVSRMTTLLYNKRIHEELQLESPHKLIEQGKWTMDKLYEMIEAAARDIDGDNQMTVDDIWGAVYTHDAWYNNFHSLSGYHIVKKDGDDLPYMNVAGNEPLFDTWQRLLAYTLEGNVFVVSYAGDTKKYDIEKSTYTEPLYMFMDGKALFTSTLNLGHLGYLRDMKDDFGILPFPHVEEEEPGAVYGGFNPAVGQPLFVPSSNSDPARTGYVFEALCYEYYTTVVDPYIESVALVKQTRDEQSTEMLKMMLSDIQVDFSCGYWYDDTNHWWYDVFRSGKDTFVSSYEKQAPKAEAALEKTIAIFESFH